MMNMLIVFNTIENVKKIRNFIKYLYLELLSTVKEFSGVLHCYAVRHGSARPFKYFYSLEQERNNGILLHFVCVFV